MQNKQIGSEAVYCNKVEICGVNTARLPILSDSQKTELLKKSRGGDLSAREQLIFGNLRLVLSVVQNFPTAAKTRTICFRWAVSA